VAERAPAALGRGPASIRTPEPTETRCRRAWGTRGPVARPSDRLPDGRAGLAAAPPRAPARPGRRATVTRAPAVARSDAPAPIRARRGGGRVR